MTFAKKLRQGNVPKKEFVPNKGHELVLILDNVYDTFNVGGMYRVSDAAGVTKIYHCGQTPIPPDPKILRASVGLVNYVPWEYRENIAELVDELRVNGFRVIVLEQHERSIGIDELVNSYNPQPDNNKIALISGNETFGVKKEVIEKADIVVELPMYGINKSLNVVVSTGIVLYEIKRLLS